jgi:hypothetical protein
MNDLEFNAKDIQVEEILEFDQAQLNQFVSNNGFLFNIGSWGNFIDLSPCYAAHE